MPFLSPVDKRSRAQDIRPYEQPDVPEFGEVFAAGVGRVFDEELSVSALLNNEGYYDRKKQVKQLVDEGQIDRNKYTKLYGEFDYEGIARDYPGLIKTDDELFSERSEMLRKRREYSDDVMARGSGMAQFLGQMTGYMLDPINMMAMPLGASSTALKGLGAIGAALHVAKTEASIAALTELGIQPLVYQHKHDIDSPYSVTDALTAIGTAATGAALLGGITGGLSGYFKKVRQVTEPIIKSPEGAPKKPEDLSLEALIRLEETLDQNKVRTTYSDLADDYARFKQGEIDSLVTARTKTLSDLQRQAVELEKSPKMLRTFAEAGGLDKEHWIRQGIDPEDMKGARGGFGKPVFRKQGGMSADALAEYLNQSRTASRQYTESDVVDMVRNLVVEGDRYADEMVELRLDEIDQSMQRLQQASDDELEGVYRQALQKDIADDIELLRRLEAEREAADLPSRAYEQYKTMEASKPQSNTIIGRDREVLARAGMLDDYDRAMDAYKAVENPRIFDGEEMIDANKFMKDIDDEIAGIEDVLRCALG